MSNAKQLQFPSTSKFSVDSSVSHPEIDYEFPHDDANALAKIEAYNKHLYRPNTYLHKWWARRTGTTFRYILKGLVQNPDLRDFCQPGGLEGIVVMDPMMGGATTLHEAIRMGANVIGLDIDPIPVLQARATLSHIALEEKQAVFDQLFYELSARLVPYFKTSCVHCSGDAATKYVLYGLRRACECGQALFVDSYVIRQENGNDTRICPDCRQVHREESHICQQEPAIRLFEKRTRQCEECDSPYRDIVSEPYHERYVPLVVVGKCQQHGQFFKAVEQNDVALLAAAAKAAGTLEFGDESTFLSTVVPNLMT